MDSCLQIVAAKDRLPRISATGALAARVTGEATVHVVGAAATPLGGDRIVVRLVVEPGGRLIVRTVAATIALPGRTEVGSTSEWQVDVGADGFLDLDPEPTIVAADAWHSVKTVVRLSDSSSVRIRERVQIGRSGEGEGRLDATLIADLGERPLLRHSVELGGGTVGDDVITRPRALVGELRYPDDRPVAVVGFDTVRLPLALGGSVSTWLGSRLSASNSRFDSDVATVDS